jgi:hypothetical protein
MLIPTEETRDCDRFVHIVHVADLLFLVLDGTRVHPSSDHGSPSAMPNTEYILVLALVHTTFVLEQL